MLNILTLAVAGFAVSLPQAPEEPLAGLKGKAMPSFTMTSLAGKKITNASLRGKVVLFDFWATWCGPCKAASPAMQKLHSKFAKKGLVVIGADSLEQTPGPDGARKYAKEHGYSYTMTYNNEALTKKMNLQFIPAFALMDKKGVVREAVTGLPGQGGADALFDHFSKEVSKLLAQ